MIIHCDTTRFLYEVLEQGEYRFMFDDLTVLDVGCNIGAFSLWIAPRAEVIHAVDVSVANIENLNKTIAGNEIPNIRTYCCAITGRNGRRWVSETGGNAGNGGWQVRDIAGEGFEADGYTLASFMDKNRIPRVDILKLDVEGAEYEIMQADDFPVDRISTVVGEIHAGGLDKEFTRLGYRYIQYGSHFVARR